MTREEIKLVVSETVRELKKAGMIRNPGFSEVALRLRGFYQGVPDGELKRIMEALKTDPYIKIIPLYYGNKLTIEDIAYTLAVDTSTIVRNKKRLLSKIYDLLESCP